MAGFMSIVNNPRASAAKHKRSILFVCGLFAVLVFLYIYPFSTQSSQSAASKLSLPSVHAPEHPPAPPTSSNAAIIIEGRPLTNLTPLLLQFATVLGPSWPIIIYTTSAVTSTLPTSAAFLRALNTSTIQHRSLPPSITFHLRGQVSAFLTSPWLWTDLEPYSHILLFQADSMICSNSESRMEDFTHFDFIGAPISPDLGKGDVGMNGGLSLRNRTLMLDIVSRYSWADELAAAPDPEHPPVAYEDQWFYAKMMRMNAEAEERGEGRKVRLPSVEEAKRFSVETIWYDRPLGYHQVPHWWWERVEEIDRWCPEHRMAIAEKISN